MDRRGFLHTIGGLVGGTAAASALSAISPAAAAAGDSVGAAETHSGNLGYVKARAYLCNNPRWQKSIRNHLSGQEIPFKAFPVLVADFHGLPADGPWDIGAIVYDSRGRTLATLDAAVPSKNGRIHRSWELEKPLRDPASVLISARCGSHVFKQTDHLRVYRLHGRVTDFDGKPIEAVVSANGVPGVATSTDRDGKYELRLPDRLVPSLLAMDAGFGKDTLECWVYGYWPEDDLALDMRVGQIEVYELNAWRGYCGLKVDFIPMSVGISGLLGQGKQPGLLKSVGPALSDGDIAAELDGVPVDVLAMHKREEITSRKGMNNAPFESRPEYSLQLAEPAASRDKSPGGVQVLRVTVRHHLKQDGRDVIERGEGLYLGLRSGISCNGGST